MFHHKLAKSFATTTTILLFGVMSAAASDKWEDVSTLDKCHTLAQGSKVEFQECRHYVSANWFNRLLNMRRAARSHMPDPESEAGQQFQVDLYDALQMDEDEYQSWRRQHSLMDDPLHYAVLVRASYPETFEHALDANRRYNQLTGEELANGRSQERLVRQIRLLTPHNFCAGFLPDLGCPELGDAFDPHPDVDALVLGAGS